MVSAVILNWKRPDGVREICKELNSYALIEEIIVWNNNPEINLSLEEKKVRVINCSHDFGLFTRFAAASLAKHECILFHDDDVMGTESTLNELYQNWGRNPFSCHTMFGRNPKNGEYSLNSHYGQVQIVLTRYVMVHRKVAVHALTKIPEFADIPGVPVGNGEDIILSYAAIDYSGKLNRSYRMKMEDLDLEKEFAISRRFPGHIEHRSKIIQRCKMVFKKRRGLMAWNRLFQFKEKVFTYLRKK